MKRILGVPSGINEPSTPQQIYHDVSFWNQVFVSITYILNQFMKHFISIIMINFCALGESTGTIAC